MFFIVDLPATFDRSSDLNLSYIALLQSKFEEIFLKTYRVLQKKRKQKTVSKFGKNSSALKLALKSGKSTNYILLGRKNLNLKSV